MRISDMDQAKSSKNQPTLKATVIVSTFNRPDTLEKVIWGFQVQTCQDFELIIADDGSSAGTADLLTEFQRNGTALNHLWQEDKGFRKNRILNVAIDAAQTPYLIFTDGDCIPRADFVETHLRLRKPGHFLSVGSHVGVPEEIHHLIDQNAIQTGNCFDPKWLRSNGYLSRKGLHRVATGKLYQPMLNFLSHRKSIFTGNGSSVWKKDAVAINGFDERMQYGGDDKEFGVRLVSSGVKSKMCKYSLISLHLDHDKPYMRDEWIAKNHQHLRDLQNSGEAWTEAGITRSIARVAEVEPIE